MWPGYFMFNGTEIINSTRTEAYAAHNGAGWFRAVYEQEDLAWLLGEHPYGSPLQDEAPWTDPDVLDSYDFWGAYPLEITGFEGSTVQATIVESVVDGGYVTKPRKGTRSLVFSTVLVGASECAVEYGMRWLRTVLTTSPCFSANYGVCGGVDICYLGCEPCIDEGCDTTSTGSAEPQVQLPHAGASGDLVANGGFETWRGDRPVDIAGVWMNDPACYPLLPDGEYGNWQDEIDIGLVPPEADWQGWAAAAAGEHDDFFRDTAATMATLRQGRGTTWVRPFYEFNGDWMFYSVGPGEEADFRAAMNRTITLLRQEFTGVKVMLGAACSDGGASVADCWPAVAVDALSADFYNTWPWVNTVEDFQGKINSGPSALESLRALAQTKNVPFAVSEWANASVDTGGGAGGGDAPVFFEAMRAWLDQHAGLGPGQVRHEIYFNVSEGYDANFYLVKSTGSINPSQPTSIATYRALWGTGVPTPPPAPPDSGADACYARIGRSMHDVTTTVGPVVTAKMNMNDGGCAWTVTWTMTAANPAEFGVEKPIVVGFLDPAVEIPYYGGVIPDGGIYDTAGHVDDDPVCPTAVYTPVYDPTCTLLAPPPDVPTVVPTCFDFPVNFRRFFFTVPSEDIPLWMQVVPVVKFTTKASEARNVRLRFYADTFGTGSPDSDPCNYCGDIVISYIPPSSTLVLDGVDRDIYLDSAGIGRRRADALATDSTGKPLDWPELSCGFGYVVTVDMPQQQTDRPIIDLALVSRII